MTRKPCKHCQDRHDCPRCVIRREVLRAQALGNVDARAMDDVANAALDLMAEHVEHGRTLRSLLAFTVALATMSAARAMGFRVRAVVLPPATTPPPPPPPPPSPARPVN